MPSPLALIREQEKELEEYAQDQEIWPMSVAEIKSFHLASLRSIIKAVREKMEDETKHMVVNASFAQTMETTGYNSAKYETILMLRELEEGIKE